MQDTMHNEIQTGLPMPHLNFRGILALSLVGGCLLFVAGQDNAVARRSDQGKAIATPRQRAWKMLDDVCTGDKTGDRATAILVLGLIPNDPRAANLAAKALTDDKPDVRAMAIFHQLHRCHAASAFRQPHTRSSDHRD